MPDTNLAEAKEEKIKNYSLLFEKHFLFNADDARKAAIKLLNEQYKELGLKFCD